MSLQHGASVHKLVYGYCKGFKNRPCYSWCRNKMLMYPAAALLLFWWNNCLRIKACSHNIKPMKSSWSFGRLLPLCVVSFILGILRIKNSWYPLYSSKARYGSLITIHQNTRSVMYQRRTEANRNWPLGLSSTLQNDVECWPQLMICLPDKSVLGKLCNGQLDRSYSADPWTRQSICGCIFLNAVWLSWAKIQQTLWYKWPILQETRAQNSVTAVCVGTRP